jgi:hypothetical protein
MSVTTKVHNGLYNAMVEFFNAHIKDVNLDYTIEGVVTSVLGNNQYTVKINNIAYTVPGTVIPTSEYKVGMIVWIEVPNQNFSQKYIKCQKPY